jgi:hypothetical protein
MLREITGMTQDDPREPRRWFHDDFFDLFVRQNMDGQVIAMDLCYGSGASQCALAWRRGLGYFQDGPTDEPFDAERLATRFARECGEVPQPISSFVLRSLKEYAQLDPPTRPRREKFRRERWQQLTGFGAR